MSLLSMCRTTCQLQRHTITQDTSGGIHMGPWPNVGSPAACDVQPATSRTIERYAQKQIEVSHQILLADDLKALAGDRAQVTDDRSQLVRYFKIEGYRPNAPGYDEWPYIADAVEDAQVR